MDIKDGVKILHLNGSYYDMGYQHGYLCKDEIESNYRMLLPYYERWGFPYERIVNIWHIMDDYLPDYYIEEMQGMADGVGWSFEKVAVFNTLPAIINDFFSCSEISIWGDATSDGKLYHLRSFDWVFNLKDPETNTTLQENILVFVRNPDIGYASLYPDFAGDILAWNGMNEKGIAVGENSCFTNDTTFHGIGPAFRMRMVLDFADNYEDALDILDSNRTCGTNFVLSDGNVPIGFALDQTANISYIGKWDDPVEGKYPFWQIKEAVRRTTFYVSPRCAEVEKDRFRYRPNGIIPLVSLALGRSNMFIFWTNYKSLSKEIERHYGDLDLNSSMDFFRDVYKGKTSLMQFLFTNVIKMWNCLFQFVCCPETGEMLISFADPEYRACDKPVHYFNLFDLLNEEPPT